MDFEIRIDLRRYEKLTIYNSKTTHYSQWKVSIIGYWFREFGGVYWKLIVLERIEETDINGKLVFCKYIWGAFSIS